jgi:hypothetical protein
MGKCQPDSPSRMSDGSLDEAARMVDRSFVSRLEGWRISLEVTRTLIYMPQGCMPL